MIVSYVSHITNSFKQLELHNLTFLTNNFNGLQSFKIRIKSIEYFKSKLNHNGFLFL